MEKYNEDIFGKLPKDNGSELWYRARHYVLDVLPPLDGNGIDRNSSKHVHVILENTEDIMLAVARQIALTAHYPNFDEDGGNNRTVITFCNCKTSTDDTGNKTITGKVGTPILGNLLTYCKSTYYNFTIEKSVVTINDSDKHLPLDIEFEFTTEDIATYLDRTKLNDKDYIKILKDEIPESQENSIDVSKGMLVNMVYCVGSEIQNLPPTDNDNVERYSTALKVFCYKLRVENVYEKWFANEKKGDKGNYTYSSIANNLSSVFCADCFSSRLRGILDIKEKSISEYLLTDFDKVMETLSDQDNINAIVRSEHARWNVEKLIMGFRPFSAEERCKDETLFGQEKKDYRNSLKKKHFVHIDLASYKDLRRVDIDNMKYDYFLMLAMPQILLSTIK